MFIIPSPQPKIGVLHNKAHRKARLHQLQTQNKERLDLSRSFDFRIPQPSLDARRVGLA